MKKILVGLAFAMVLATNLGAQGIYATLSGLVTDQSSAVVPQAKVTLKNADSGSQRDTVSNTDGYFTFASVPAAAYELSVEAKGFTTFKVTGITLAGGESRTLDAKLTVGTTTEAVEVTGEVDKIAPVSNAEKTNLVTAKELQNFIQVGSNAAEFIKIMPGFGIVNGTSNSSSYTGQTIGINGNGDAGSQSPLNNAFSYNGLPGNSLDITADGAHVSDPGCNCDTPVNPNSDMISEIQVKMSNFSAENQKGPAVITSVAKAGGRDYHGSGFFYARNYVLNANDALFNASGAPRPEDKYYYPGGTFGGPVLIPGTHFNKDRNKLFFFTGFEYFYQVLDTGLLRTTVPTAAELGGNFSPASVAAEGNLTANGAPPGQMNAAALAMFPGGIISPTQLDPNMQNLMKLYPQPNANPNENGGYNYVQAETFNQNNIQWMSRVDYSISDNTKLFIRYNLQKETQQFPVGLWWRQNDQVPYPTPVEGKNQSNSVTASLTHVFSPTMTNEFVFAYTYVGFPNVFADPSKVNRANVGYTYKGLFNNGVAQIPSFGGTGWTNQEASLVFMPGGFEDGGASQGLYADKYMPSASDTLTKVWGTHTIKAGVFWEYIRNAQPDNGSTNGQLEVWNNNSNTFGNEYADLLYGNLNSYSELNKNRINDIAYNTSEAFVQDSWKATRRLTLELGIRFTHFQPWYDREGFGYSVFIPADYNANCPALQYCGYEWHSRDSAVPLAGFPTRALFYQPRLGAAFDLSGQGKTVLRGGWGRYYYHSGQFTSGLGVSGGEVSYSLGNNINGVPLLARNLSTINLSAQASSPQAVNSTDNNQPYTDSYNFTVSQRTPFSGLLEASYVGNRSRDALLNGAGPGTDFNNIPFGAMLSSKNGGVDPNSLTGNNFRPITTLGNVYQVTNNEYYNYNALQITWVRTKGRYTINMNYTYGKSMGIVGIYDQYNMANNYGVMASNRPQIFNAAYSIELGTPIKGNKFAGGFINGWQLSGITQLQSGVNLPANSGENFGMSLSGIDIPGTKFQISNTSILGTQDDQLGVIETCNPTKNLKPQQYINPSCFTYPTQIGQNGATILPPIYGPAFFNSDLGMFKNFNISESKKLQFRFNAYNFLNHPLWSFNGSNLGLGFGSNGQVNTPEFGTTTEKQGHRIVQAAVKFYF